MSEFHHLSHHLAAAAAAAAALLLTYSIVSTVSAVLKSPPKEALGLPEAS